MGNVTVEPSESQVHSNEESAVAAALSKEEPDEFSEEPTDSEFLNEEPSEFDASDSEVLTDDFASSEEPDVLDRESYEEPKEDSELFDKEPDEFDETLFTREEPLELFATREQQVCAFCHTCGGAFQVEGGVINTNRGFWGYGDYCSGQYSDGHAYGGSWVKLCCQLSKNW